MAHELGSALPTLQIIPSATSVHVEWLQSHVYYGFAANLLGSWRLLSGGTSEYGDRRWDFLGGSCGVQETEKYSKETSSTPRTEVLAEEGPSRAWTSGGRKARMLSSKMELVVR